MKDQGASTGVSWLSFDLSSQTQCPPPLPRVLGLPGSPAALSHPARATSLPEPAVSQVEQFLCSWAEKKWNNRCSHFLEHYSALGLTPCPGLGPLLLPQATETFSALALQELGWQVTAEEAQAGSGRLAGVGVGGQEAGWQRLSGSDPLGIGGT